MAVPRDWQLTYHFTNGGATLGSVTDVRGICPHCRIATSFQTLALQSEAVGPRMDIHLILACSYGPCRNFVYVNTSPDRAGSSSISRAQDPFFLHPSGSIEPAHANIPPEIADDWLESQRSLSVGNPKATAVMLRRVLYGVLLDKGCTLYPLKKGMEDLISGQRLPGIFDEWLPAIRDDGHDAAHPDRALHVSSENVIETMEYTGELLRYLYIEPYEFQQRKARQIAI
ncbi:MAG: hypothetical protein JWM43_31 [Acidobacteriaceae bacterium]|nr:hypothetical protein [Acidobacteriaceae bacterium]